jgi:hypothetical protein
MTLMGMKLSKQEKYQKKIALLRKRRKTSAKPKKRANLRSPKAVSLPKLKRKLWKLISAETRKREPRCVSCGQKGSQAGHYIKKSICNLVWQYARKNIHTQCVRCNVFLHGNPVEYRKWMVAKYGQKEVEEMESLYNLPLPIDFNPREYINDLMRFYGDKNT